MLQQFRSLWMQEQSFLARPTWCAYTGRVIVSLSVTCLQVELSLGTHSFNSVHGVVPNPLDMARTAGGNLTAAALTCRAQSQGAGLGL